MQHYTSNDSNSSENMLFFFFIYLDELLDEYDIPYTCDFIFIVNWHQCYYEMHIVIISLFIFSFICIRVYYIPRDIKPNISLTQSVLSSHPYYIHLLTCIGLCRYVNILCDTDSGTTNTYVFVYVIVWINYLLKCLISTLWILYHTN